MKKSMLTLTLMLGMLWGTQAGANCWGMNCPLPQIQYQVPQVQQGYQMQMYQFPQYQAPSYDTTREHKRILQDALDSLKPPVPKQYTVPSALDSCLSRCYRVTPPNTNSRNMCLRNCSGGW